MTTRRRAQAIGCCALAPLLALLCPGRSLAARPALPPLPAARVFSATTQGAPLVDWHESAALLAIALGIVALLRRGGLSQSTGARRNEGAPPQSMAPGLAVPNVGDGDAGRTLRVDVVGPVRIAPIDNELREFGRSLVCYLAIHADWPRSVDDTQTALWPVVGPKGDITRKTFLNQVSAVRRSIEGHLPGSKGVARYALMDFTVDWDDIRHLVEEPTRDPEHRIEGLTRALALVRGVPFESEVGPVFQWTDTEGIRTLITRTVVAAAIELHSLHMHESDLAGAEWALRQGLRCSPFEPSLWELLATVIRARGDAGEELRFWHDAMARLDEAALRRLRDRIGE